MNVVGPRPHAVAHNEQARALIKATLPRLKVKPGITGWAQAKGLRAHVQVANRHRSQQANLFDRMIIGKTRAVACSTQRQTVYRAQGTGKALSGRPRIPRAPIRWAQCLKRASATQVIKTTYQAPLVDKFYTSGRYGRFLVTG